MRDYRHILIVVIVVLEWGGIVGGLLLTIARELVYALIPLTISVAAALVDLYLRSRRQ